MVLRSLLLDPRHVGADLKYCAMDSTQPGPAEMEEQRFLFYNRNCERFEVKYSCMLVINNTEPLGEELPTTSMSWFVLRYAQKTRGRGGIPLIFIDGHHPTLLPSDPYSGVNGLMRSLVMQLVVDFKQQLGSNYIDDNLLHLIETGDQ